MNRLYRLGLSTLLSKDEIFLMMMKMMMMMMSCSADRKAADQSGSDSTDGRLRDPKDRWVELLPRRRQLCVELRPASP